MTKHLEQRIDEGIERSYEKKSYEKPRMEEHEPLEESTATVYYYYSW
jgi:hypothetical protein